MIIERALPIDKEIIQAMKDGIQLDHPSIIRKATRVHYVTFTKEISMRISPFLTQDGTILVRASLADEIADIPATRVCGPLQQRYELSDQKNTYVLNIVPASIRPEKCRTYRWPIRAYTVNLLFSPDGKSILLQEKNRTSFAGLLNGVGGKLEPGETDLDCAIREIREETGCSSMREIIWLGDLFLPHDCTPNGEDAACMLHFYAATAEPSLISKQPGETEPIGWCEVKHIMSRQERLAGNGDLVYFIQQAVHRLNFTKEN